MNRIDAARVSVLSAVTASACCLPPLAIVLLGVGGATTAAALARYHWWFLGAATILLGVAFWMYSRERRCCKVEGCSPRHRRAAVASLSIGSLIVVGFGVNAAIPYLGVGPTTEESVERARAEEPGSAVAVIPIEGMTCPACAVHVRRVLGSLPGVLDARVSVANGNVVVGYDASILRVEDIVSAIDRQTGYTAAMPRKSPGGQNDDTGN